jgi:hypothetical protein
MPDTLLTAIEVLRQVCAANDEALLWLDEIEAEVTGAPGPFQAVDDCAKLAAWNAWAAQ